MLAFLMLLLTAVRFILRWTFALIAALLVPPLALLVRPWMRRRKLSREDAIVAVVEMAERCCGWLWRCTVTLLGSFIKRRFRSLVWHADEFTLSPLGKRLLTKWGFRTFFVMMEEPRLGGGFLWDIEWKNGPSFAGRLVETFRGAPLRLRKSLRLNVSSAAPSTPGWRALRTSRRTANRRTRKVLRATSSISPLGRSKGARWSPRWPRR